MKQLLLILIVFFNACAVHKTPVKNYSFDVLSVSRAGDIHSISFIEAKDTAKKFSPIYYEIRDFAAGRGKIK